MKAEHAVTLLCAALRVSRAGYYAWVKAAPSARAAADTALRAALRRLHTKPALGCAGGRVRRRGRPGGRGWAEIPGSGKVA